RRSINSKDPVWAQEWDRAIGNPRLRDALFQIRKFGGDSDFCLYVIVDCRWRRITGFKDRWERRRILSALNTLLNGKGDWSVRLQEHPLWAQTEGVLVARHEYLKHLVPFDEGVFWSWMGSDAGISERAIRREHYSVCIMVTDAHLRHASGRHRVPRRLL